MNISSLKSIYFSPTGTTKSIIDAISTALDADFEININITQPDDNEDLDCTKRDLLVIGFPIYSGRVPQTMLDRLSFLKGNNTPAVIVAVYGNAKVDDALLEMKELLIKKGFNIIGASSFIGEHSYSTAELPIGVGRPDSKDLSVAKLFGEKLAAKLDSCSVGSTASQVLLPGNTPYKSINLLGLGVPDIDKNLCNDCGICASVCPTNAIDPHQPHSGDDNACISCYACIKSCPQKARFQHDPLMETIKEKLYNMCIDRKEPQLYL